MPPRRPRRSYDQYCALARGLDLVGDRWTLLVVRELLAGPRRYTDLHADLPGVSTDMLATRLKDMERDGLATRRRLAPPGAAYVYELTARGRELLPVITALGLWGAPGLTERRPTDAVRAHWAALPLRGRLAALLGELAAVVDVHLDEGAFHVRLGAAAGASGGEPPYGEGPAVTADAGLVMDADTCARIANGALSFPAAVRDGLVRISGEGPVPEALRKS